MSIHILGNGHVSAVCDGATIIQAFGPTYSSPNAFRMEAGEGWKSRRIRRGVFQSQKGDATITDIITEAHPYQFVRIIKGYTEMKLITDQKLFCIPSSIAPDSYMSECHGGQIVYPYEFENGIPHGYVSGEKRYFGLRLMGDLSLVENDDGWTLSGEGTLVFAFAKEPGELFANLTISDSENIMAEPDQQDEHLSMLLDRLTPEKQVYRAAVLGVYDTIVSQQSISGGVLAGYNYHLCYLRDNYGVCRGLRAMGADTEADALVDYYVNVYRRYGDIHNAQGPDEFAFHVHENDAVEITAYLVLMLAERLYRTEPDDELNPARFALFEAMMTKQHNAMIDGMLPFNGDETYIAGGMLSRACMNDGSMEATALYHKCLMEAEKLAGHLPAFRLPDYVSADRTLIEKTFREHFYVDGHWVCNCPGLYEPAYRHGVRACGHGFGLAFRNENGDYVCHECLQKHLPPIWEGRGERYAVPAAVLCPSFIDSPLIPVNERIEAALSVLDQYETAGCGTGYDLGFVLWTLCEPEALNDPAVRTRAVSARERLLSMTDEFGAYSEYYRDGFSVQSGTLCRPWESGINIAAILRSADVL